MLIALAVAARVYGNSKGIEDVLAGVSPLLPPSVVELVGSTLVGLVEQGFGAGVLGVVVLDSGQRGLRGLSPFCCISAARSPHGAVPSNCLCVFLVDMDRVG